MRSIAAATFLAVAGLAIFGGAAWAATPAGHTAHSTQHTAHSPLAGSAIVTHLSCGVDGGPCGGGRGSDGSDTDEGCQVAGTRCGSPQGDSGDDSPDQSSSDDD